MTRSDALLVADVKSSNSFYVAVSSKWSLSGVEMTTSGNGFISHSPELIYAINIIFNINSLVGSGPIGIIQSAQQCHLRSL